MEATKKTFWEKVKKRISSENISKGWKITRNVAGGIYILGTFAAGSAFPATLSPETIKWIGAVNVLAGVIAGVSQLNTGKK